VTGARYEPGGGMTRRERVVREETDFELHCRFRQVLLLLRGEGG